MSSFKSTDIPYSRLCQAADDDHEFINLEELNQCHLNELEVLNESGAYEIQNPNLATESQQTAAENLISHNPPQKDPHFHGQNYNEIMYQTIPQQAQYEHQLQIDDSTLNQPYSPHNQNHYLYYPRNYDQNTDAEMHLDHSQVYPQQQIQNQFYYHINSLNNYNDNLNRFIIFG